MKDPEGEGLATREEQATGAPQARPDSPQLLAVDDDELVIESLRDILEPHHPVVTTRSPLEALQLLQSRRFDILLTDLMMPQMHGLELIRLAKSLQPQLLMLVLTGYGSKDIAIAALRAGAFEFLEKPLSPEIVLTAVDRAWQALSRDRDNARLYQELQAKHAELLTKNLELEAMAAFADLDPAPLLQLQTDGQIIRSNPAAKELVADGIVERKKLAGILPAFADVDLGEFIRRGKLLSREVQVGKKIYQFILRGVPGLDSAHLYGSDITELTQAKEQLNRVQRLEAVGKLAAGIAHDFNNIMTVITFCATNLLDLSMEEDLRIEASEIKKAAEKCVRLTRQLLTFSRKEIIRPQMLDLNQILVETYQLLNRTVGENISLNLSLGTNLPRVLIDRGGIEQVIVNLVVNARDAMRDGGKLTVETASASLDGATANQADNVKSGQYVLLAISDTGVGMTSEVQDHIFEPFFTTKPTGEGTGMGLSIVYGIVKRAEGYVWASSEPGHGTTVRVYLPVQEQAEESSDEDETITNGGQGERILLVEDDAGVRRLTGKLLRDNGYQVLDAEDGVAAQALAEQHHKELHLLLTDVVMPKMSGKELADQLRLSYPGLRVLFMSGYPDSTIAHHGILADDVTLVSKPFSKKTLLQKIREVLEQR